jgi:hypothetical protein
MLARCPTVVVVGSPARKWQPKGQRARNRSPERKLPGFQPVLCAHTRPHLARDRPSHWRFLTGASPGSADGLGPKREGFTRATPTAASSGVALLDRRCRRPPTGGTCCLMDVCFRRGMRCTRADTRRRRRQAMQCARAEQNRLAQLLSSRGRRARRAASARPQGARSAERAQRNF